jgi:hypothetical protein
VLVRGLPWRADPFEYDAAGTVRVIDLTVWWLNAADITHQCEAKLIPQGVAKMMDPTHTIREHVFSPIQKLYYPHGES